MKNNIAVTVENLSKSYVIGDRESYLTIREQVIKIPRKIIELLSKSKKSDPFRALNNVSFKINKGEVVGVIGRNGAGKSTLLKILSQIVEPSGGKAILRGKVASLLEVGTGFNPELTGRENIYLNGAILGMKKQEINNVFDDIVEFSGVDKFIDTPVKKYSSGMHVRLGFAVAAHLEADIMLVDEVLAVGDVEFQKKCLGKMSDLSRSGRTVIFVSHNMGAVAGLCSKAIFLDQGKLISYSSTRKTISKYLESAQSSITKISQIKKRSGEGNTKIRDIYFTSGGKRVSNPTSGNQLSIYIKYQSSSGSELVKPKFGISVTNMYGSMITHFNSHHSEGKFNSLKSAGMAICHINKLSIMPGNYQLTFRLMVNSNLEDQIEYPQSVTVTDGKYFTKGPIINLPRFQGVFSEQEWDEKSN